MKLIKSRHLFHGQEKKNRRKSKYIIILCTCLTLQCLIKYKPAPSSYLYTEEYFCHSILFNTSSSSLSFAPNLRPPSTSICFLSLLTFLGIWNTSYNSCIIHRNSTCNKTWVLLRNAEFKKQEKMPFSRVGIEQSSFCHLPDGHLFYSIQPLSMNLISDLP